MKCEKEQVLSAQQERSSCLCPFFEECSSIDLERIKGTCADEYGKCADFVACRDLVLIMESKVVG